MVYRLLTGKSAEPPDPEAVQAWDWGPLLVARRLWDELGLEQILDQLAGGRRQQAEAFSDRVFALVCDRRGRRYRAQWRDDHERRASKTPRVRVAFAQLQRWYRTLDRLIALKPTIETELFARLRSLFALEVDLVLYDLTSTYPAPQVVQLYKELGEVERAFRNLKDVIDMRPIFHQTDQRVQAHVFIAALAFLLHRALEKKLKEKGIDLSADQAITALKTLRVVDLDLGQGNSKRWATKESPHARAVLKALGIKKPTPPIPPEQPASLM